MKIRLHGTELLARLFRGRGAHQRQPEPDETTVPLRGVLPVPPAGTGDDDVPPSWLTRLDLKPRRARPYVQPGDGKEGQP